MEGDREHPQPPHQNLTQLSLQRCSSSAPRGVPPQRTSPGWLARQSWKSPCPSPTAYKLQSTLHLHIEVDESKLDHFHLWWLSLFSSPLPVKTPVSFGVLWPWPCSYPFLPLLSFLSLLSSSFPLLCRPLTICSCLWL